MKKLLFLSILLASSAPAKNNKPLPQMPVIHEKNPDDEVNTEVIVSNVAGMLDGLGKIVPDPYNPVVVATGLTQIGVSFAKIVAEMFKNIPEMRNKVTEEHIVEYFLSLPPQTQFELIRLLIEYSTKIK